MAKGIFGFNEERVAMIQEMQKTARIYRVGEEEALKPAEVLLQMHSKAKSKNSKGLGSAKKAAKKGAKKGTELAQLWRGRRRSRRRRHRHHRHRRHRHHRRRRRRPLRVPPPCSAGAGRSPPTAARRHWPVLSFRHF